MKKIEEIIEINNIHYFFNIYIERRKNSRGSVRGTKVNIRIPSYMNHKQREKEISQLKNWAINKIKQNPDRFKPKSSKVYEDGEIITVGDEEYLISIIFKDKKTSSARIENGVINLFISSNLSIKDRNTHISKLIGKCIAKKRLPELKMKINYLNNRYFQEKINRVVFKNNNSNFGSCSSKGNINISTRLLFAPDDIIEYVCIPELAHLKELNHSEKYWKIIEDIMPDYMEKEKWLKDYGAQCYF